MYLSFVEVISEADRASLHSASTSLYVTPLLGRDSTIGPTNI
jgi:hypothetical protein